MAPGKAPGLSRDGSFVERRAPVMKWTYRYGRLGLTLESK